MAAINGSLWGVFIAVQERIVALEYRKWRVGGYPPTLSGLWYVQLPVSVSSSTMLELRGPQ